MVAAMTDGRGGEVEAAPRTRCALLMAAGATAHSFLPANRDLNIASLI